VSHAAFNKAIRWSDYCFLPPHLPLLNPESLYRAITWAKGHVLLVVCFDVFLICYYLQYSAAIASNTVRLSVQLLVQALILSAQYVVGCFACLGGFLFGMDISSMSGVLSVRPVYVIRSRPRVNASFRTMHTRRPSATYVGLIYSTG
jgi:hypothetical protein